MNYVTSGWRLIVDLLAVWRAGIMRLLWALSMIIVVWLTLETRRYVVIANGNQLYYYQYGWDAYGDVEYRGELMPLGEPLPAAVKTLSGMDVTTNLYKQKYPYAGQLGVALEDGSFFIYGVVEDKIGEWDVYVGFS